MYRLATGRFTRTLQRGVVILAMFFGIGAIAALLWGRRRIEARGLSLDAVTPLSAT